MEDLRREKLIEELLGLLNDGYIGTGYLVSRQPK
jgi:hypothetical protein